ncbi:MAG TPA: ribokinase [Hellea balneolensis]|uniref:Ribokinase n=1 Tax=Hellea balneolensis TaxID=287478 RepID=A0A7C3C1D4_9PROT|nr:ribokinase [Hellea balneolensis]
MRVKTPVNIVVIGSINFDISMFVTRFPKPNETISGGRSQTTMGGKGLNQAVAAARMGARVHMVGCVGRDSFGQDAVTHLTRNGVTCDYVVQADEAPTGCATITVDGDANNMICVSPGANWSLRPEHIIAARETIATADIVVVQAEIPTDVIEQVFDIAEQAHVPCVFNPAPAKKSLLSLLGRAQYVTPNESETETMTGINPEKDTDILAALDAFDHAGTAQIIMTRGARGISYRDGGKLVHVPTFKVDAVDSTGAGDVFNGVLAVGLAQGLSVHDACVHANGAAALSVTRKGADAAPTRTELAQFLKDRGGHG